MTDDGRELTPDEIEQRQLADGGLESDAEPEEREPPASPDVIEQRQTADGAVEGDVDPALADEPLTPDEIEQRQPVGSEPDWDEPATEPDDEG